MAVSLRSLPAACGLAVCLAGTMSLAGAAEQAGVTPSIHARSVRRLIIRNAMVIYGSARPPAGPSDILVEDGVIAHGAEVMVINGKPVSNTTAVGPGDRAQAIHGGGIEWTIKDGIPYHVPTLMREVRDMVATAPERTRVTTPKCPVTHFRT